MKLTNIIDLGEFFKTVESCDGNVFLISKDGDRLNLKSDLTRYYSVVKILTDNEIIKELELYTSNPEDAKKFISFMECDK